MIIKTAGRVSCSCHRKHTDQLHRHCDINVAVSCLPDTIGYLIICRGYLSHLDVVFTDSCSCFQAAVSVICLWDLHGYHDKTRHICRFSGATGKTWPLQCEGFHTQSSPPHRQCHPFSHQTATRPAESLDMSLTPDSFSDIEVAKAPILSFT